MNKIPAYFFAGVPGIKKTECLRNLRNYLIEHNHLQIDQIQKDIVGEEEYFDNLVPIIEFPRFNEAILSATTAQLRQQFISQETMLERSIEDIKRKGTAKFIFMHSHLSYCFGSTFYSWLSISEGLNKVSSVFDIKSVITLIENVFYTRSETSKYSISIQQIASWRDVEVLIADLVSRNNVNNPLCNSTVISVHQPIKTLCDILLYPVKRKLYLAFPITELRRLEAGEAGKEGKRKAVLYQSQNILFRQYFHKDFISFDPSSIDEVLYRFTSKAYQKHVPPSKMETITPNELWPLACNVNETILGRTRTTTVVPKGEIQRFVAAGATKSTALRAIRARDFRLIDQSDALVIFRPTLKGEWSRSVYKEFGYARSQLKPICILKDISDGPLDLEKEKTSALGDEYGDVEIITGDFLKESEFMDCLKKASDWALSK